MAGLILRIAYGTLPSGSDAPALLVVRDRLARAAAAVQGLESLVVAARSASTLHDGTALVGLEAAVVTVWSDATARNRSVEPNDPRSIANRLDLPIAESITDEYDIVGRWFAALPPESTAYLRILSVRATASDAEPLVAVLLAQQPRLVDLGIIASHVGRRRLDDGSFDAVHVSVWPDRATLRAATRGMVDRPIFARELDAWRDAARVDMYDAIEIAPRLPRGSGPPLVILDEDRRIVDVTTAAAAVLGMPPAELIGGHLDELAGADRSSLGETWRRLLLTGTATGEWAWAVPAVGAVLVSFAAGRDIPVPGRHALLVRRRHDPAPTTADLEAALAEAFPRTAVSSGGR
jgi:PAS domain-containing protein